MASSRCSSRCVVLCVKGLGEGFLALSAADKALIQPHTLNPLENAKQTLHTSHLWLQHEEYGIKVVLALGYYLLAAHGLADAHYFANSARGEEGGALEATARAGVSDGLRGWGWGRGGQKPSAVDAYGFWKGV